MFEILPASVTTRAPRQRAVLLALGAHLLVIGVALGATSAAPVAPSVARLDTIRLVWTDVEPPPRNDFRPDEFVPHSPPIPEMRFDAPPLRWDAFKFQPTVTGDPRRFILPQDGAPSATAREDTTPVIFRSAEVDQLPELIEELHPRYPAGLERDGVSGVVQVEYVVSAGGQVDRHSVRVLSSTHPGFLMSTVEALRTARFRPARRGGRPIAVLVQQTIRFSHQ
jgi:TonB family protein